MQYIKLYSIVAIFSMHPIKSQGQIIQQMQDVLSKLPQFAAKIFKIIS